MEGGGSSSYTPGTFEGSGPDQSPADAHAAGGDGAFDEHPEVFVGAAFAGGLALAGVLRWLGNR